MTIDAPTRATGYVLDTGKWWGGLASSEPVPELRWPQSVAVFDQMRRDARVASVLRAVSLPIRRTPWRIEQASASDEVTQFVADNLGLPITTGQKANTVRTRDRFSWAEHLRLALTSLTFGHAVFEQEARIDGDGMARLRRLGFRPQATIAEFNVARDGGLVSVGQLGTDRPMPVRNLVVYAHEREGGDWTGRSLLRPAYKDWLLKDRLLRVDTIKIERNGVGIPHYTGPENPADPEGDLAAGQGLAEGVQAGEQSGLSTPYGSKFELLSVQGQLPDALPRIHYHDAEIASSVLGQFMNLGQSSGTGSYALGVTFVEVFNQSLQTIALDFADTATQHIVEDLVDWNWGPNEPAPRIVFDEIGSAQQATALGIKALIDAGLIRPDRSLEEWVRQTLGMPPKDIPEGAAA